MYALKEMYIILYSILFCEVSGNTYKTNLKCLYLMEKKVIRVITHSEYLAHTNTLYHSLELIKLNDIIAC